MALNLMQLQNSLKGLSDEELTKQMQTPNGQSPQFMVMQEKQRRQSDRARYEGERAKQAQNQTTVAEDMARESGGLSAAGARGQRPGGPPAPGGSLPPPGAPSSGGIAKFATGGLVDMYRADLMEQIGQKAANKKQAQGAAMLQAGLAIMGGTSPNWAENVSRAGPAIQGYTEGLSAARKDRSSLLREGAQFEQAEERTALAGLKSDIDAQHAAAREAREERRLQIAEAGLTAPTTKQKEWDWLQSMSPAERAEATKHLNRGSRLADNDQIRNADKAVSAFTTLVEEEEKRISTTRVKESDDPAGFAAYRGSSKEGLADRRARAQQAAMRRMAKLYPHYLRYLDPSLAGDPAAAAAPPARSRGVRILTGAPPEGSVVKSLVDSVNP